MALKLYFAADNSEVSGPGQFANAVIFTLRADQNEVGQGVRLYAEANSGFEVADVVVSLVSANGPATTEQWSLAADDNGSPATWQDWGDPLELGTVGAGSGGRVYFWVRARASDTESVGNDDTVLIQAQGVAGPV